MAGCCEPLSSIKDEKFLERVILVCQVEPCFVAVVISTLTQVNFICRNIGGFPRRESWSHLKPASKVQELAPTAGPRDAMIEFQRQL
jgi:hypothetical protein